MDARVDAKLAVVEARLADQRDDVDEHELRLRKLEQERATIRSATRELRDVRKEIPRLVDDAACRAVTVFYQERRRRRRELVTHRATLIGSAATVVGTTAALLAFLH
jgi:septal ring factor EnvC (AmiA/AmiB activator)